jgi:hypothetical protein
VRISVCGALWKCCPAARDAIPDGMGLDLSPARRHRPSRSVRPLGAHGVSDLVARVNNLFYGAAPADGMSVVSTTWRVEETGGMIQAKKCRYCSQIREHREKC